NEASSGEIQEATKVSDHFAQVIARMAKTKRFKNLPDLKSRLQAGEDLTGNSATRKERQEAIDLLDAAAGRIKFRR
ncbi:hypothetical protein ACFW1M_01840, partial [Streptomyces inhibens]|uniref:hypothetical protein n=1 Tax=Streptomyces inhibens TaxID=2293571 RepID=UPI00368103DC